MPDKVRYDTGSDVGALKVLPDPPSYVPKPLWQPFPGFSFLFNNPGVSLQTFDGYQKIQINPNHLKCIDLYAKLAEAVNRIDSSALAQRFHFFALPSSTYHVTVWDGINKGNENRLSADDKQRFLDYFSPGIGGTIHSWPPFATIPDYTKWFKGVGTIRLRYHGLRARASTVLIVELEADPDHHDSRSVLDEIKKRRTLLDDFFAHHYGKPANYELRPHVAIGYFADPNFGDRALFQYMDTWVSVFDKVAKATVIEFSEIELYAFLDMVTYFKPLK